MEGGRLTQPPSERIPRRQAMRADSTTIADFPHEAEADGTGLVAGFEAIAIGGPHVRRRREPRAAARLVLRAVALWCRGALRGRLGVVGTPAILRPLEHVAECVGEPERVWRE